MKKIKNFKINLRQHQIIRLLKTTSNVSEITPQLEEAVRQECSHIQKIISPAAIYETFTELNIADNLKQMMPDNFVAVSFYVVTINDKVEKEIKEAQRRDENILCNILHSISLEGLEQSINFIQKLILEEAKDDCCVLTERQDIKSSQILDKIVELLPLDKINVQLTDNRILQPIYTSCGFIPWIPQKKLVSKR